MDDTLPEGRIVKVEFEIALPAAATHDQIEDWIRMHLGSGGLEECALSQHDPEAFGPIMLHDTRMQGRKEEYDIEIIPNGRRYKLRTIRTPA